MYRREIAGAETELHVTGLWGSGNTMGDVALRFGDETVYTMWDGHALLGPGRPQTSLEKYPVLVGTIPFSEFLDRYADYGGTSCEVMDWDAIVGEDCEATCINAHEVCAEPAVVCEDECPTWPRSITDCVGRAASCDEFESCGVVEWRDMILPRRGGEAPG